MKSLNKYQINALAEKIGIDINKGIFEYNEDLKKKEEKIVFSKRINNPKLKAFIKLFPELEYDKTTLDFNDYYAGNLIDNLIYKPLNLYIGGIKTKDIVKVSDIEREIIISSIDADDVDKLIDLVTKKFKK